MWTAAESMTANEHYPDPDPDPDPTLRSQMYMIVPLTIYVLERLVRLVLPHVRNTELVDVKLMGGNEKVCRCHVMTVHLPSPHVGIEFRGGYVTQ